MMRIICNLDGQHHILGARCCHSKSMTAAAAAAASRHGLSAYTGIPPPRLSAYTDIPAPSVDTTYGFKVLVEAK
jgi:hypothetical protein